MALDLTGDVEVVRVDELLDGNPANIRNKKFLADELSDPASVKYSFAVIEAAMMPDEKAQILINTLYRPTVEPAVAATVLTLDCQSRNAAIFEPTPRPITANFSYAAFSGITNTNIIQVNHTLTGSIVISFESDIQVSNPSSLGIWDDILKELTIAAGTADKIEFNFLWHKTAAIWDLKVGEVSL